MPWNRTLNKNININPLKPSGSVDLGNNERLPSFVASSASRIGSLKVLRFYLRHTKKWFSVFQYICLRMFKIRNWILMWHSFALNKIISILKIENAQFAPITELKLNIKQRPSCSRYLLSWLCLIFYNLLETSSQVFKFIYIKWQFFGCSYLFYRILEWKEGIRSWEGGQSLFFNLKGLRCGVRSNRNK